MTKIVKKWTDYELAKFIELFPNHSNQYVADKFKRSVASISYKAKKLNLRKTSVYIEGMKLLRAKGGRRASDGTIRHLTFDDLKEIALKYKTKTEFRKSDNGAYTKACRIGIIEDICNHMSVLAFSTPQLILKNIMDSLLKTKSLYNDRKTIKPLEIDIYYTKFNLAFEYQGKKWHADNKTDEIKLNVFKKKNINIIYIIENSLKYETDIKSQLVHKLAEINKICNTTLTIEDIKNHIVENIYLEIYNKEDLINIAKGFDSFKNFRTSERSVYRKLINMKLLDDATIHMNDRMKRYNLNDVKQLIKKYNNIRDLKNENYGIYQYVIRNKLTDLIKS